MATEDEDTQEEEDAEESGEKKEDDKPKGPPFHCVTLLPQTLNQSMVCFPRVTSESKSVMVEYNIAWN